MSRPIPVSPEKWGEMVQAWAENTQLKAEVKRLEQESAKWRRAEHAVGDKCIEFAKTIQTLKAEVEAHEKRWAESEDLISHYKQQRDEAYNDCQCHRLKAELDEYRKSATIAADSVIDERNNLKAEVQRLTANIDKLCKHGDLEIERLKAEVERLRKAGDALYESEIGYYGEQILVDPKHHSGELCRNWNAAKEGKPSEQKSPSFIEDLGNGVEKHDLLFRYPAKEGKQP